jgi:hypothetical protein
MPKIFRSSAVLMLCFTIFCCASAYSQDTIVRKQHKPMNGDFLSRLDFGGYLGAQFGDVTLIDVSPIVTYRVTEKFNAGIGLTYQYYKINYTGYPDYKTSSYGGSVFARYYIWRDLFAHVEYAPLYVSYNDPVYQQEGTTWVHDFLIGGGYRQWIGQKAYMSLMILWNVNETYYSPYRNPIIRIGFGAGL